MGERSGVIASDPRRELRITAAVLAIVIALLHLLHPRLGAPRLIAYLEIGTVFNPLPVLFTLVGGLILFGIVLVNQGLFVRTVYLLGFLLMSGLVVGYALWHTVLEHGAFWPYIEGHGHRHGGYLELLWLHLRDDTIGAISKLLEILLAAVLAMLYLIDRPS